MAPQYQPLLDAPQDSSTGLKVAFGVVGLATSELWNQVMLSVSCLTILFGETALADAATYQNSFCLVAMIVFTLAPKPKSEAKDINFNIFICAAAYIAMIGVAGINALLLSRGDNSEKSKLIFLIAMAVNGVATGTTQNLAASLSGRFPGAPASLLLGESLSPITGVVIYTISTLVTSSTFQIASISLFMAMAIPVAALFGLLVVYQARADGIKECHCNSVGGYVEAGGKSKEYVVKRLVELAGNSIVAFLACSTWLFLLTSSPVMAKGLCLGPECAKSLPPKMISAANLMAALGRFGGMKLTKVPSLSLLIPEGVVLATAGAGSIYYCASSEMSSFVLALAIGVVVSAGLTFCSNFMIIRNNQNAQNSCGHSIVAPCPVTTQIMWLSNQLGFLTGVSVAANIW